MIVTEDRWESVGGRHGRFGTFRPWYAQRVIGWEPDPDRHLVRRKVVGERVGPFKTKREADAYIAGL